MLLYIRSFAAPGSACNRVQGPTASLALTASVALWNL